MHAQVRRLACRRTGTASARTDVALPVQSAAGSPDQSVAEGPLDLAVGKAQLGARGRPPDGAMI